MMAATACGLRSRRTVRATTASKPRTDENVAQASYSERSSGGLQLRPHTQPTGILSGLLGETKTSKPTGFAPKPQAAAAQASAQTAKSSAASKSMLPKFLSGTTKFPSLNKTGLLPEPKPKTAPTDGDDVASGFGAAFAADRSGGAGRVSIGRVRRTVSAADQHSTNCRPIGRRDTRDDTAVALRNKPTDTALSLKTRSLPTIGRVCSR